MKKHLIGLVIAISTFTSAVTLLPVVAYQIGKLEARLDLLQGKRKGKRCIDFCVQAGPSREWESTLAREFDLEMVVVPPCLGNVADHERVRGYNIQQSEELEKVYGKAMIEEEGRKSYQRYLLKLEMESEFHR